MTVDEYNPDFFYGVRNTLVVGEVGAGKTWYCINHPQRENAVYLDLERRYSLLLEYTDKIKKEQIMECLVYNKDGDEDYIKTFKLLKENITKAIKENDLIVVDGVSDIRRMAVDVWKQENPKRKNPVTSGDWAIINNKVKKIIYRLLNLAKIHGKQTIITGWLVDEFKSVAGKTEKERTGKKIMDLKEFITSRVDEIIRVACKKTEFYIRRGKSPRGPTDWIEWTEEVADDDD